MGMASPLPLCDNGALIIPKKLPKDSNQRAYEIVRISTGEAELPAAEPERSSVSAYLSEIGRKGGIKGGVARARAMSASARKRSASNAARARWKHKQNDD